ncbi:biotin-(acetyl-CoA-carboxylase) ligase [Peptoanaerobacter stomatis]|uniref:Bifunctional ligase/repressor BirA n=2 Tax=Peptoanaerobacter stomatis TaxID=796937 RepID=J6H5L2_9FIRM|nr:biotin-(acetyl-CoA-carboxylase) ligase [Peptoanaerobacter stomatis]NWO24990.1 biotin--[acetyl-CoA-carboxylase] ligase [Peptostreptococcaceae bacterium oral taxon 081]
MENSDVLKILYENKGEFVSGEEMANRFNISRAALSKRIAKLKDKGIEIDAVTNKGYKLKFLSNNICEENASLGILENQVIGNTIFALEEIDSTNEYAKKIAKNNKTGTVVTSNLQTSGKGRRGRGFVSEYGGLYFSIILKPNVSIDKIPFLTQLSACSVYKAMEELKISTKIKWPNDIILNDKKLCGILCEMSCEMDYVSYVVAGIGINIANVEFDEDLQKIATTLEKEGHYINKLDLFWRILRHFDYFYKKFEKDDYNEMIDILRKNSSILGKKISVISLDQTRNATALDIDEKGFLKVQYENGETEHLNYGEISIRNV